MKRTLVFLLVAVTMTSAALAQTPTVAEKPAVKKPASQAQAAAKAPAKTPFQSSKPSTTTVKTATVKAIPVPAAKPAVVVAKPVVVAAKPVAVPAPRPSAAPAKPVAVVVSSKSVSSRQVSSKSVVVAAPVAHAVPVSAKPANAGALKLTAVQVKPTSVKSDPFKSSAVQKAPAKMTGQPIAMVAATAPAQATKPSSTPQAAVAVQDNKPAGDSKPAEPVRTANRRDPFVSPVVNLGATGSGCSSGKRCLAIDEVALKGVVRSDAGMIAVVVNSLDKAYFLRENDPVFNGYVLKITGDSIVFKETFRDKLGKPLTRDVTKSITAPAV